MKTIPIEPIMPPNLALVVKSLREIGLALKVEVGADGFLPAVRVHAGGLIVDPSALISDTLHEAGHLAIFPAAYRHLANDDIDAAVRAMFDDLSKRNACPDGPEYRAALQSGDAEATAWAYAFGVHIGLRPEQIIQDDQYDGTGDVVRLRLQNTAYLGINGLRHAGMCRFGFQVPPDQRYPVMQRWLQV